jgi:cystathionine beta-synthase
LVSLSFSLLKKYFETGELDNNEVYPYISEGFGEDFVPQNYDMQYIDEFTKVTDKDGAVMARRIAKEEGIFIGYSCGSCLQGVFNLKDQLKPEDVVVCIFHDHGSRYIGKVYNDEWMMERGFLDVNTFKDIINGRKSQKLISLTTDQTVMEAIHLMKKFDIENIPVFENGIIVGAISESGLFNKMLVNSEIKTHLVKDVLENPYPEVSFDTPVERLSNFINKENGAVMSKDDSGLYQIVTKYDIIQSLSK